MGKINARRQHVQRSNRAARAGYTHSDPVIAGLDPAIHLLRKKLLPKWMDPRVEPAGDRLLPWRLCGQRAQCAGSDIKEINRTGRMVTTDTLLRAIPGVGIPLVKPVIAALHGYCIGMGMTLALHCDLRLAAKNTVLGYPEVRHGMISAVSALHLPQVIPSAQAMEMLLMARNISAEEAWRWGLVNAVVDDVAAEAEKWAATISGYSPAAVQATKRLAMFSRRTSQAERVEIEAVRAEVETHDDYKDGAAVFAGRK
jgi:enoyl-CoA hydratase